MIKRVKGYTYGTMMASNVKFDTKKYNIKTSLYGVMSMNSYNSDQGLTIINGNNPKNDNEVAVSVNILKDSGLSVGDYIELSVNNKKNTYLISGCYSTLANNGYQIRMLNSEVEKYNPNYIFDEMFVNLKNNDHIEMFEKDINKKYSYAGASDIEPNDEDMIETIPGLITSCYIFTYYSIYYFFYCNSI